LETRDVLQVLEQKKNRPLSLEKKALRLSGKLIDLCLNDRKIKADKYLNLRNLYKKYNGQGEALASYILKSGKALLKMKEIIKAQGGDPEIDSEKLELGSKVFEVLSPIKGKVISLDNKALNSICRILGAPEDKKAGIYLTKKIGDSVFKKDMLYIMYSSDSWRLNEARETLKGMSIYKIE